MFEKLEELDAQMAVLNATKATEIGRLIEFHPLHIGDEVVVNNTFSHMDKTMVVDSVSLKYTTCRDEYRHTGVSAERYRFVANGCIKKKNGDLGRYRGELVWRD